MVIAYRISYFRTSLIHKATKKWVDLFAPEYEQNFTKISIDYKMYKATTLESQILYLAHDLLSRINRNKSVREKWIKKLELLSNEQVNWNVIQSEYENNSNYFHTVIPAKDILHYVEAKKYVEYSIFTAKDHITSNTLERLKAIFKYPDGSVATPNGIVVEKKSTALKLYLF